ncbi:hypothetical protein BDQ17DRAFT_1168770, partial [Cyathus striatus]
RRCLEMPINRGFNLIDIQARNESIELMKLKSYANPDTTSSATWAKLTDSILASNATSKYKKHMGPAQLQNVLLQYWKVNLSVQSLPISLKRMLCATIKHEVKFTPTEITLQIKQTMPFWFHIGLKEGK